MSVCAPSTGVKEVIRVVPPQPPLGLRAKGSVARAEKGAAPILEIVAPSPADHLQFLNLNWNSLHSLSASKMWR